jgi:CheY-like chemotaxis protein
MAFVEKLNMRRAAGWLSRLSHQFLALPIGLGYSLESAMIARGGAWGVSAPCVSQPKTWITLPRSRYKGVTAMLRVLVVDDDQDNAATLSMLLRLYGHEVVVAADGPSAVQAVQANPPDVVLLDLALPKMDGWQVAQQIRQNQDGKRPLIIVVSGYGTDADKLRSQEAGIDLHLIKPVDPAELEDLLKRFRQIIGAWWNSAVHQI